MLGFYLSAFSPILGARKLYDPDGNIVSTTGSLTEGLNEGIALAIANKFPFKAFAGGPTVNLDTYLTIQPCGNADIDLGTIDLLATPSCNGPGLYMSSFNGGRFSHKGRFRYNGTGTAGYYIAPAANDPFYGQKIIQNAKIEFGWLQLNSQVGQGILLDPSQGSIIQNDINYGVVQGWNGQANLCAAAVYVGSVPNGTFGFNENHNVINQVIGYTDTAVQSGTGSPNDLYLGDNDWLIESNPTGINGQAPVMVKTYASYDCIRGAHTIYTGASPHSIVFLGSANHNRHQLRQDTSAGGVQNNSLANVAF